MNSASRIVSGLAVLGIGLLLSGACGSAGTNATIAGDPARKITLSEWCSTVGERMCSEMGERCVGGGMGDSFTAGCVDGFVPGCVADRDGSLDTGRTGADLQACSTALTNIVCEQMLTVAAMDTCGATTRPGGSEQPSP